MVAETTGKNDDDDNYYYCDDDEMMSLPPKPSSSEEYRSSSSREGMSSKRSNDAKSNGLCLEGTAFLLLVIAIFAVGISWTATTAKRRTTTAVKEWQDLRLEDITHWCLDESYQTCDCINPLNPVDRAGHLTWSKAHRLNVADANTAASASSSRNSFDVVFLGDSITEGWKGMRFGNIVEEKRDIIPVFQSLFNVSKGGDFDGLALGIAGDKSPNLLWRIQNGEIPSSLQPKVWWILIGTNDFLKRDEKHCSVEVVFMGIKRVVEEMRLLRPTATIVVNGILPRTENWLNGRLVDPQYPKRRNVWNAISDVNSKLDEYCSEHNDTLRYFDGRKIFIRTNSTLGSGDEALYIPQTLMGDYIHPTVLGYTAWGRRIVKTLHSIID